MARLARIHGNVRVVCTSAEFARFGSKKEKRHYNGDAWETIQENVYPVMYCGEPDLIPAIIQNEPYYQLRIGEATNYLSDWQLVDKLIS